MNFIIKCVAIALFILLPACASPQYDFDDAVDFMAKGRMKKAVPILLKTTHETPDNIKAWTLLGDCYFKLDSYPPALTAYKKALQLDPNYGPAHFGAGIVYDKTNNLTRAFEAYKLLIKLDPELANKLYEILFDE